MLHVLVWIAVGSLTYKAHEGRQCEEVLRHYAGQKDRFSDQNDRSDWYLDDGGDMAREQLGILGGPYYE